MDFTFSKRRKRLTKKFSGEETVTSATSQPAEGIPGVLHRASPNPKWSITCTVRVFEGPSGSQYLQITKETVIIPQTRIRQRSFKLENSPETCTMHCGTSDDRSVQLNFMCTFGCQVVTYSEEATISDLQLQI